MDEATPEQAAACERAMDGLEAQADIWADEIDLVVIIKNIGAASRGLNDRMPKDIREGFISRQEANIDALVRQAYLEGFDRGGESRKAYDAAQLKEATDERDELQELFDLQWKADRRAVKLWQAAHPGNDLVWPDRTNMVVWLMERSTPSANIQDLIRELRDTHPRDSGYAETANKAADALSAVSNGERGHG